jgi:hypothetical protein
MEHLESAVGHLRPWYRIGAYGSLSAIASVLCDVQRFSRIRLTTPDNKHSVDRLLLKMPRDAAPTNSGRYPRGRISVRVALIGNRSVAIMLPFHGCSR